MPLTKVSLADKWVCTMFCMHRKLRQEALRRLSIINADHSWTIQFIFILKVLKKLVKWNSEQYFQNNLICTQWLCLKKEAGKWEKNHPEFFPIHMCCFEILNFINKIRERMIFVMILPRYVQSTCLPCTS